MEDILRCVFLVFYCLLDKKSLHVLICTIKTSKFKQFLFKYFYKISVILNAKLLSMFGITWYFDEYGGVRYFNFNECHRHDHQNRWLYQSRFQAVHCNNIERSDHTVVYHNRQLLKVNFQRRILKKNGNIIRLGFSTGVS